MLGISRGTLRTALQRLEDTGEIVRRQGSGTFVGRVAVPSQLDERLERLETYSSLARRRGVKLSATNMRIEERAVGPEVGELLELDPETVVVSVFRVLNAADGPVAVMFDVISPAIAQPDPRKLERRLEQGDMVLDVLLSEKVAVSFARTRVMPCLATPREQVGEALALRATTAVIELEEVIYAGGGDPVAYSRDIFAPGALDVHVMRSYEAATPTPVVQVAVAGRRTRGTRASA